MKIATRNLVSLSIQCCFVIVIGLISFFTMKFTSENMTNIKDNRFPDTINIACLNYQRMQIRALTSEVLSNEQNGGNKDIIQKIIDNRIVVFNAINESWNKFVSIPRQSERGRVLVEQAKKQYLEWKKTHLELDKLLTRLVISNDPYEIKGIFEEYRLVMKNMIPVSDMLGSTLNEIQDNNQKNTSIFLKKYSSENSLFSIIIMSLTIAVVLMTICFGIILSKKIINPINTLKKYIGNIMQGETLDLSCKIYIESRDEIEDMVKSLNHAFDSIRNLVSTVSQQTFALQNSGNNLSTNMIETASAINEITANIQSIKNQTTNQSASITETSATMEQITKGIDKLNTLIENQSANVTQSSSAIEEMMANIGSVTQTLIKNGNNIEKLSASSEAGKCVLEKITVAIRDVAKESEGLMEISKIIQGISSQTNLLSMNAAIEAAHAGELGKGFAVVADEIRKLAESSSSQTKIIETVLKSIKDSMVVVIEYSEDVVSRFTTIEAEVKTVAEQEYGILKAMEEQSEGSKQVLEAITMLNDITQKVQTSSSEMLTGSNQVSKEARNMNIITQEISGGMNEMTIGADQVTIAISTVNELSVENKERIDTLINKVSLFKV